MAYQPHVTLKFKSYRRVVTETSDNEVCETYEKSVPICNNVHTGHDHCTVCGFCFIGGLQFIHRCPEPVNRDILEVMFDEMRSTAEKTRIMNRTSEFKHRLAAR